MSEHNCPQCGKPATPKSLISKKTGKPFIIFECTGNCKNEQGYKFSFFPPKELPTKIEQKPATDSFQENEYTRFKIEVLEKILDELNLKMAEILSILKQRN